MGENRHSIANKKKFEIFLEVAKGLNEFFSVTPIITGSLGLYKIIGDFNEAKDIDVWVSKGLIEARWQETVAFMRNLGFELKNEHEHEFFREGEIVAFGSDMDLAGQIKISPDALSVSEINGIKFKEFTAEQYFDIYKFTLHDSYRQNKKEGDDQQKIKLIEEYIKSKK